MPIRKFELLDFKHGDWAMLDKGGMEIHDLSPRHISDALALGRQFGRLSANDCLCLVTAQSFERGILLTGDSLLRAAATSVGVCVHGVLWVIDQPKAAKACDRTLLTNALEIWKSDQSVFLPTHLIDRQLRELH